MNRISPAFAAARLAPEFIASLSDAERLVLPYAFELWLRPEQRIPRHDWHYYGFMCGRGWGKSLAVSVEINRRVRAGEARAIALMAPNEDRVEEVQIQFLVDTSPPWFKAERYQGGVLWPNGVRALTFTPEAPGRSRSGNFDLSWLCEIVDWQDTTRKEAFKNLTTATRIGRAQVFWDTTSKGKNDVIQLLLGLHASDPRAYPIQRGAMFDNPLLSAKYLRTECRKYTGREAREEVWGESFTESAGASWLQAWLDRNRVLERPRVALQRLVSIDPALSTHASADETGLVVGETDDRDHAYLTDDLSGRHAPETWGDLAVGQCVDENASGVIIERNHLGDNATACIRSRAVARSYTVRVLSREQAAKPFPRRTPGVIYVREVVAASSKTSRSSGPACEDEAGRVHMVGTFPELELELTTYEPGTRKSPNRLDAYTQLISELRELVRDAPKSSTADVDEAIAAHKMLQMGLASERRGAVASALSVHGGGRLL